MYGYYINNIKRFISTKLFACVARCSNAKPFVMNERKPNPLSKYLEDTGIRRADFARRLGVTRARVTQICSGGVAHLELARRIEMETEGKIPVDAWLDAQEKVAAQ